MASIVVIAPFPDCYFHLVCYHIMQGPETNIDLHHLGEDLEHSEDHRWSKFVTKTVCL